jgi:hypothetical protein
MELPVPSDLSVVAETLRSDQPPRAFSKVELCDTAASVAEANNLPVPFFTNLIHQESGFKPNAVSPAGAQGIAQFMPRVAAAYGLVNPFDPIQALAASGRFLAELVARFGNLGLAAAAYNAGPKRVQNWMAKRGKLPAETRNYVRNITGRPAEQWTRSAKSANVSLPARASCAGVRTMVAELPERASASSPVRKTAPAAKQRLDMGKPSIISSPKATNRVWLAKVLKPSKIKLTLTSAKPSAKSTKIGTSLKRVRVAAVR